MLEVIIAIAVMTIGLFAVWSLFLSHYNGEMEARLNIVGANLAREGLEVVKNIRDTNWLKSAENEKCGEQVCTWDEGLSPGAYTPINLLVDSDNINPDNSELGLQNYSDYDSKPGQSLFDFANQDQLTVSLHPMPINGQSYFFYHQDNSQPTAYRRLIILKSICCSDQTNVGRCDENQSGEIIFSVLPDFGDCSLNNLKVGIEVESRVDWRVNEAFRTVSVRDQLFNWK